MIGSTDVTTASNGVASINLILFEGAATGLAVSATATNLTTGDTSAFSNDALMAPVEVEFAAASVSADQAQRIRNDQRGAHRQPGAMFSVAYATGNGTAQAGVNYTATLGTLVFDPQQAVETFTIPINTNTPPSGDLTVDLGLSDPTGGASLGLPRPY